MSDVKIGWSDGDETHLRNGDLSRCDIYSGDDVVELIKAERERGVEIVREVCESKHIPDWDKPDEIIRRIASGRKAAEQLAAHPQKKRSVWSNPMDSTQDI